MTINMKFKNKKNKKKELRQLYNSKIVKPSNIYDRKITRKLLKHFKIFIKKLTNTILKHGNRKP